MLIQEIEVINSELENVIILKPMIVRDYRGQTLKNYSKIVFKENGINFVPVETLIIEGNRGTLRGIHFQRVREIDKLVHCIKGKVWVVVVDLRKRSDTIGKYVAMQLDETMGIYIPKGYGLGTLSIENSVIICQCGDYFVREYDDGIIWDDKDLNINWPIQMVDKIFISDKDCNLQSYKEYLEE